MLILCMRTVLSDMRTVCVGLSVNGIFHQAMMEGSRPTLEGALVGKNNNDIIFQCHVSVWTLSCADSSGIAQPYSVIGLTGSKSSSDLYRHLLTKPVSLKSMSLSELKIV